jgi:predicted FMN-binding regulatory protein PaiB
MKDYPEFRARSREEIDELLASQRLGRLIAVSSDGWPQVGLHPYTWDGHVLEVHLVNSDEQLAGLRGQTQAVFEVDDILSSAPSHWVDEQDATNADHFYRCVIIRGPMTLSNDVAGVESHLQRLLAKYQPENRYAAIDRNDPRYGKYMAALTLIRIEAQEIRSKFKLAQRTSEDDRNEIVRQLRERSTLHDHRTGQAIERANRKAVSGDTAGNSGKPV